MPLTLEQLGLSASVNPLTASYTNEWFEYDGYFRRPAHCQVDVFARDGEGFRVVIVTELEDNDGTSITNAIESVASAVCRKLNIMPANLLLIEHYPADSTMHEHFDLVRFGKVTKPLKFESPQWFHLDKMELERLLGLEVKV